LLRVFGRDLSDKVDEHATGQLARFLEGRHALLLGPVRKAAGPEVVVLVEALVPTLREVIAAALEAILERGECLLTVDLDPLRLGLDLVLEIVQVLLPGRNVDRGHDRGGEVEHLLELARGDVEQVADAARHALEEPDVRDRRRQVDVPHALPPDLLPRHLDATALADDPLVADALVLAAVALPVLRRTKDALAEETVALRLERAVVDRLRLGHLAGGPVADLLAGGKPDANGVEIVDVDQARVLPIPLVPVRPRQARALPLPLPLLRPRPRPRCRSGHRATRRSGAPSRRPGRRAPVLPPPPRRSADVRPPRSWASTSRPARCA